MNPDAVRAALLAGRRRPHVAGGQRPFPRRGDGLEMAELRAYVDGDDPRRIDWAASARAASLHVRVLFEERAYTFAAIIDGSASMRVGRARPLLDAAYEALGVWCSALHREDRIARVDDESVDAPRLRGPAAARHASVRRESTTFDLAGALRLARAALPRDAFVLAVTDAYDAVDDDLLRALAVHADCTMLVARDPWASDFPLHGFVTLRDAETNATARMFVGRRARARYRAAALAREAALLERLNGCGWRAGALIDADGAGSLFDVLGIAR